MSFLALTSSDSKRFLPSALRAKTLALTAVMSVAVTFSAWSQSATSGAIWIEGENTSTVDPATFQPIISGGPGNVLSGGKWLSLSLAPGQFPPNGLTCGYEFTANQAAGYQLWMHLGFEQIRAPFDWRIDQGPWTTVPNTDYTVDVQEIGVWAPVAWMNLGSQNLTAGNHILQIRINNAASSIINGRIVFALDAICLTSVPFHPDGVIPPGDKSWMTQADHDAEAQVFDVGDAVDASQTGISLKGKWQYAGDDEFAVDDRLGPVKSMPAPESLNWHAIPVPGDRNGLLPSESYVHRFYLRTRVRVPASLAGHSFVFHVPGENMIGTLFVNEQPCGWTKNNYAAWDCDVTQAIKPGQVNEICIAIKDSFYGLAGKDMASHPRYVPYSFWSQGITQQLDMPVVNVTSPGLVLEAPSLVVSGSVYSADVFAMPSVKNKTLGLQVTLHNSGATAATVQLDNEIEPLAGGPPEKTFAGQQVIVPAGQDATVTLNESWPNPKLWWQDDPQQYNVVTRLSFGGKVIDELKTKFGFREWTWDGPEFKLNGIPWHGFADIDTTNIETLKKRGQDMERIWWTNSKTAENLDECDAKGMPVRRTGIFDGELASYQLADNPALWDNYRAELLAWAKGQRNHPSIFIWSMENEISFINGHVMGQDRVTTTEMKKASDLLMALDPTRPVMTDGGNANLDESLPVYGGHYMEPPLNTFPEGCYDIAAFAHRQVWPITQKKPILLGEAAFVTGTSLAEHATVGGEQACLGEADARPAMALELRMLSEGYRWNGVNFHFWAGNLPHTYYNAWQPLAILARQWNWTFGSGQMVTRTFGIFNDTRSADPISLKLTLTLGGKKIGEGTSVYNVPPGGNQKFDLSIPMPSVTERQEGTIALELSQSGKTVFSEEKDVSLLPPPASAFATSGMPALGRVLLFDPTNSVRDYLAGVNLPFSQITDLAQLPDSAKVLIVGKDALTPAQSTSSQLAAWAVKGRVVIVLEQANPLKFQALPGEMNTDTNYGCLAFPEISNHPVFDGLAAKDFSTWGPVGYLYRNAYAKPASDGRSLLECDTKLADTALVEMQAGDGLLLLNQLLIGETIKTNPVAQRLLLNLVSYADKYQLKVTASSVVADEHSPLAKALDATGLNYTRKPEPLAIFDQPKSIAVLDANPANLKTLASNLPKVNDFTQNGGWIILNNLTPDGLADFNTLVGVNHLIRPFGREKVSWPVTRNPLTAGLSPDNIVIGTGKQIVVYKAGDWPDPDGYSYVVDLDDAAPFASSSYGAWGNAVGGYTMADGEWRLIENLPASGATVPIKLAQPEKIVQFGWTSDLNYQGTKKIQLTINGKDYSFDTIPNGEAQNFDLPDQPTASELTFKITDWTHDPAKAANGADLVGIDNIRIKVARPPGFFDKVKPMLNIGALVEYPNGQGGIILCNVKFKENEPNPANTGKKQALIANLLHNLNASFSGGKSIIVGTNLAYTPVDISRQANQFRNEQGWFGDRNHTFAALPSDKQTLAGVTYDIYHFTTSPVPEAIMLGGANIPGNLPDSVKDIPVNQKADALFFLQAARIDRPRNSDEIAAGKKNEMADYVVHYADGQVVKVPIYAEISVGNYRQPTPEALPGAQVAWSSPYTEPNSNAVAYSMQWNNPRPKVEISTVDLVYGSDRCGVPALLAITAANSASK